MSRTLSADTLAALYAQATDECFLLLLTLTLGSSTYRFVNNTEDVVSDGDTYAAFPFKITLPTEEAQQLPRVELVCDNVSQELVAAIRSISSPPTVVLEVIRAADPDTIEAGPFEFQWHGAQYDALLIRAQLGFEPLLSEPFPAARFTPSKFPGLFN